MKTILFVGGGSLGHVVPSYAVSESLSGPEGRSENFHSIFACCPREDETNFLERKNAKFFTINAPKFPRNLSSRTILFPFEFFLAFLRSFFILSETRPATIFSKGGYLSVPVCLAARFKGIQIVLHCSDSVSSLSDRLVGRLAKKICTGFPFENFPRSLQKKCIVTGNPVRKEILTGNRSAGMRITGFSGKRPVVMIMGGSQGAQAINDEVEKVFDALVESADVIHITGVGKKIGKMHARYFQREIVFDELPHLLALADIVVTRAGAGALAELSEAKKACIVIPLEGVAHDHQVRNAQALADAVVLVRQSDVGILLGTVKHLIEMPDKRRALSGRIASAFPKDAAQNIAKSLLDA